MRGPPIQPTRIPDDRHFSRPHPPTPPVAALPSSRRPLARPCSGKAFRLVLRDHGLLPPLLLAPDVQDVANRAVLLRRPRLLDSAARTALVGRASSPSPR